MPLLLALLLQSDLIRDLGHDDPARREAATAKLVEAGPAALDALRAAAASGDPEIALRARAVVEAIERNERLRTLAPPLKRVTLDVENTTVDAVVRTLSERTGVPVDVDEDAVGVPVDRFDVREATLMEALAALLDTDPHLMLWGEPDRLRVDRDDVGTYRRGAAGPVYIQVIPDEFASATVIVDPAHSSAHSYAARFLDLRDASGAPVEAPADPIRDSRVGGMWVDDDPGAISFARISIEIIYAAEKREVRFRPDNEPRILETDDIRFTHRTVRYDNSTQVDVRVEAEAIADSPRVRRAMVALTEPGLRQRERTLHTSISTQWVTGPWNRGSFDVTYQSDGSEIRADQIGEMEFDLVVDSESVEYVVELGDP